MKTIQAKIPDYLAKLTAEAAEKEKVSVDQIIALALSAQVAAWNVRDDIETRAKRGKLEDFDRVMAKVPDVAPVPGDEI
ncbi:MAG: hypothetical protein HY360_04485 [Verrucomicrobia bacterium]|nr:hypothetical protein [Verrucomicrobiota bacterium]